MKPAWLAAALLATPRTGHAQVTDGAAASPPPSTRDPAVSTDEPTQPPGHRLNLRVGLASSDEVQRPTVCLEVVAFRGASIEGCGTGSGILHDEVGRQIAHFRVNVPVYRRAMAGGWSSLRGGLGFAELEVGPDRPGFDFGAPNQPNSVAGPDASLSMQWLRPLGSGVELVATASAGVAWFSRADLLVIPQSAFQPYVAFEIGAGW